MKNYTVKLPDETAARLMPMGISTEIRRRVIDSDRLMERLYMLMPLLSEEELDMFLKNIKGYDFELNGLDAMNSIDVISVVCKGDGDISSSLSVKLKSDGIGTYVLVKRAEAWYAWASGRYSRRIWFRIEKNG